MIIFRFGVNLFPVSIYSKFFTQIFTESILILEVISPNWFGHYGLGKVEVIFNMLDFFKP